MFSPTSCGPALGEALEQHKPGHGQRLHGVCSVLSLVTGSETHNENVF